MSEQWPIPKAAAADAEQPLLPLAFTDQVELIKVGGAIDALARSRAGHMLTHGHTPEADLLQPPGHLAREAKERLQAFLDIMGPQRMNMPPERRTQLLRYVGSAGAMIVALWDRLQVEVPDE